MALPDYIEAVQGTPIVWGDTGTTGQTHLLTFSGLTNTTARQGARADLGDANGYYADEYLVYFRIKTVTAPTAGATAELYLVSNFDTSSYWPGKVDGTNDAAYAQGTNDATLRQLGPPTCIFVLTADTSTNTQAPVIWRPKGRYVVPVVDNSTGVQFDTNTTTNECRVILVPRRTILRD